MPLPLSPSVLLHLPAQHNSTKSTLGRGPLNVGNVGRTSKVGPNSLTTSASTLGKGPTSEKRNVADTPEVRLIIGAACNREINVIIF
uniref:Uncharacterized protein n=1 Tax=Catharus ustulatus TaxID=91951 RepID=A0A8C3UL80_CATUS